MRILIFNSQYKEKKKKTHAQIYTFLGIYYSNYYFTSTHDVHLDMNSIFFFTVIPMCMDIRLLISNSIFICVLLVSNYLFIQLVFFDFSKHLDFQDSIFHTVPIRLSNIIIILFVMMILLLLPPSPPYIESNILYSTYTVYL